MNASFESTNIRTNLIMENDTNTINTNTSFLTVGQFSSNKLFFKNNLLDLKRRGSSFITNNEILLKDTSSLGLSMVKKDENIKLYNKIINLNNEKYNDSWIQIESTSISNIILIKIVDQCYFEGHLILKNKSYSECVVAKFLNHKNYYSITPSFFFIKPGSEIIINLKRFYKLAPDEQLSNVYDKVMMIISKTKNEVEDLNDAKVYLRKDDIFSPEYQLFSFNLCLDNGYNPVYYDKLMEFRKKYIDLFNEQTNINEIKNPNKIREHIEDLKINIKEYKKKINKKEKELEEIIEKNEKKEILSRENTNRENKKIIIEQEVFYEVKEKKGKIKSKDNEEMNSKTFYDKILDLTHDEDGVTIPTLLLFLSICLFIGKFIKYALFS